jgi:hypothetical protein
VGQELEASAEGVDVGADGVELCVPEFRSFDVADTGLRDSHGPGYVLLGEATLCAQPSELIDRQGVER